MKGNGVAVDKIVIKKDTFKNKLSQIMSKKQDIEVVQSSSGSNPGSPSDQRVTLAN